MSAATPKEARQALSGQLSGLTGVTVYPHEPAQVSAGTSVTFATSNISPDEWLIFVRVYVSGMDVSNAQDDLDTMTVAVDNLLDPAPRGNWDFGYDDTKGAFVAQTTVAYPREDF